MGKNTKKSEYEVGKTYYHRNLQKECVFTLNCAYMQRLNPDPTSVFMEFPEDTLEVCKHFIEET
jgi:hypothetical protein